MEEMADYLPVRVSVLEFESQLRNPFASAELRVPVSWKLNAKNDRPLDYSVSGKRKRMGSLESMHDSEDRMTLDVADCSSETDSGRDFVSCVGSQCSRSKNNTPFFSPCNSSDSLLHSADEQFPFARKLSGFRSITFPKLLDSGCGTSQPNSQQGIINRSIESQKASEEAHEILSGLTDGEHSSVYDSRPESDVEICLPGELNLNLVTPSPTFGELLEKSFAITNDSLDDKMQKLLVGLTSILDRQDVQSKPAEASDGVRGLLLRKCTGENQLINEETNELAHWICDNQPLAMRELTGLGLLTWDPKD